MSASSVIKVGGHLDCVLAFLGAHADVNITRLKVGGHFAGLA